MLRRVASAVILLALLAPASALAQGNDLLPPTAASPTSTPVPTVTPTPDPTSSTTGRTTLFIIGAALLLAFLFIGLWIARDARRSLPSKRHHGSTAEPLAIDGAPRPKPPHVKQKARARGKAQRRARRANRPGR
ncbi:MAG TPA: hypothetical protein VH276_11645 [Solirubrobacteraceae bacterium]|jgi:hypothetical protein|nr:hypothetical protein [Solirubrobacteraceae bacterium]